MTADRDFDRMLGTWFEKRATSIAPEALLERSLERVDATPQRPSWRITDGWRFPRAMGRPATARASLSRMLAIVAVAAIATAAGLFLRLSPAAVGGPSSAPSIAPAPSTSVAPSPSVAPSKTPAVVSPRAASWTAAGSMVTARELHTATLLPDGKVLVVGGVSDNGTILASAELYDPGSGSWTATGSMGIARVGHTATLLPDGKVLVAGGFEVVAGDGPTLASAEQYDPASGTWTATGSMVTPRGSALATLLPNGKVLMAGGNDGKGGALASAELYDPGTGSWTATGKMVTAAGDTATLLPDGKVLVAGGGWRGSLSDGGATSELYDPSSGTWTAAGKMVAGRAGSVATLLPDGKVLVAGGYYAGSASELFDPTTGSWTATGTMVAGHWNDAATLLPDGEVLVTGAFDPGYGHGAIHEVEELYDPGSGTWTATANMATPRSGQTATLLHDGKVLVAGGGAASASISSLASAELYDPGSPGVSVSPGKSASPSAGPSSSVLRPSGGMFAFIQASGYAGQLWVANLDGTGARELVPDLGRSQGTPAWSPDGTRLVFSQAPMDPLGYPSDQSRLYLTDATGSTPQLVDTGCVAPCSGDSDAAFSPDGTRLVFVRTTASLAHVLATIDLSTGRVTELASTTVSEVSGTFLSGDPRNHHPRWSPDGTQIVFTQDVPDPAGMLSAVFVVDADGTNLHRIGLTAQIADWSPDGTRIVFGSVSYVGSVPASTFRQYFDIYTIRPDGTDLRRLTSDQISQAPSWTAGGRIGFFRDPTLVNGRVANTEPRQLWIMDADGSNATQLSLSPQLQQAWPIAWPPQP